MEEVPLLLQVAHGVADRGGGDAEPVAARDGPAARRLRRVHVRAHDGLEDLTLIGFGNPEFVRYTTPAMTTIDLPVSEAGQAAVELALRRLQHPEEREVRTLNTTLLVRESTAPPTVG